MSGAQYIHYALGLLDRTNSFSPLQAVLDNEQIGKIKHCLREPKVGPPELEEMLRMVKKVMASPHRLFTRHVRKALHAGDVSSPYRFETKGMEDRVLDKALDYLAELEAMPSPQLEQATVEQIFQEIPGLLPALKQPAQQG